MNSLRIKSFKCVDARDWTRISVLKTMKNHQNEAWTPCCQFESLNAWVMANLIIKINFYCCICMCHIQQKKVLDPRICEFPVNLMRFIITRKKEK